MKNALAFLFAVMSQIATAESVSEFDLTSLDVESVPLIGEVVVHRRAPHFVSLRCPTCQGPEPYSTRIYRMTIQDWIGTGREFVVPTQQDLDAMCQREMDVYNEGLEIIAACENEVLPLPQPIHGFQRMLSTDPDVTNSPRTFELSAVVANESGVILIVASDYDKERVLHNADALVQVVAEAVIAEINNTQ